MERLVVADAVRTSAGVVGSALLIRNRAVAAVGEPAEFRRPDLAEDRYPGATIIPGLVDAHFHPVGYTASVTRLNVEDAVDLDDLIEKIRAYATNHDPATPIVGTRLNDEALDEQRLPSRHELDRAASDRPVLMYRYCGHVAIANTAALALAGVTGNTVPPPGGQIDLDDGGHPTGVLRETAIDLVADPVGGRAADLTPDEVMAALLDLRSMGLTRLGAMASVGQGLFCGGSRELALLCEIGRDLPIRLDVFVIASHPTALEEAAALIQSAGSNRLRFAGVKVFGDGSFGGRTAHMIDPFTDRDTRGVSRLDDERDRRLALAALDMGGRVAIHAIGDQANHDVLDLYEDLIEGGADPERLRIEHASVLAADDIERMGGLGVTGSVQPAFLGSEHGWIDRILNADQLTRTYAFRSMSEAGIPLAGGSDCPVEPPHPLAGMASARHRYGFHPTEALSAEAAFDLFTVGSARSLAAPPLLQEGSPADFAILDRDPVTTPAAAVPQIRTLATWIDGEPA